MNVAHDPLDRAQSVLDAAQRVLTTAEKVHDSVEHTRQFARIGAIIAIGTIALGALMVVVTKQHRRSAL